MDIPTDITKVKELLDKAHNVLIVTHENPTDDSMGSTLALYLGLTSLGKKVTVACPDPMTVALSNYVGANKVVSELSKKNFVIRIVLFHYLFLPASIFATSLAGNIYSVFSSNARIIKQIRAPESPNTASHIMCQITAKPKRNIKAEIYMPIAVFFGSKISS